LAGAPGSAIPQALRAANVAALLSPPPGNPPDGGAKLPDGGTKLPDGRGGIPPDGSANDPPDGTAMPAAVRHSWIFAKSKLAPGAAPGAEAAGAEAAGDVAVPPEPQAAATTAATTTRVGRMVLR
jgi:hypothetical protein